MLTKEVFVKQILGDRLDARIELGSLERHLGDDLERISILDRFCGIWTPNEWPVVPDEHRADFHRIDTLKALNDDVASFPFVGRSNFLRS